MPVYKKIDIKTQFSQMLFSCILQRSILRRSFHKQIQSKPPSLRTNAGRFRAGELEAGETGARVADDERHARTVCSARVQGDTHVHNCSAAQSQLGYFAYNGRLVRWSYI